MCCSGGKWKREVVPDHKWDYVDVREFHNSSCFSYLRYAFLYILVIKSVGVYCADIYTMVLLLASNHWAGQIIQANSNGSTAVNVPFSIGKWIFFGCIIFSFLLLAWEWRKSRAIIRSRDISYAFTNVMANNYYSLKSYDHFCFFSNIQNSIKKKDDFAFFVFFTFKGWKRLLLADAPRQVINGLTLYSFARSVNFTTDIQKWYDGSFAKATVLVTMIFTVVIWIGSFIFLLVAALMYVPLLCYIQGNLKEYCCHKTDKRIAELMKRKTRKRLAKEAAIARKEAMGDYSHLKDKKGQFKAAPLPQPTLPKVALEDLIDDSKSDFGGPGRGGGGAYGYPPTLGYGDPIQRVGTPASSYHGGGAVQRWQSDRDYSNEKYAESTHSSDQFVSHPAPIAGYQNGYGQQHYPPQHQKPYHGGHPQSQDSLARANSFGSEEKYGFEASAAPYAKSEYGSAYAPHQYDQQAHQRYPSYEQSNHQGSRQLYGHGEGYREAGGNDAGEVDLSAYYGSGGADEAGYGYDDRTGSSAQAQPHGQHGQYGAGAGGRSGYI